MSAANKMYENRNKVIKAFKVGFSPFKQEFQRNAIDESTITNVKIFNALISKEETGINSELFQRYFNFQRHSEMLKVLLNTKNIMNNSNLVNVINCELSDLKNEIEKMSED